MGFFQRRASYSAAATSTSGWRKLSERSKGTTEQGALPRSTYNISWGLFSGRPQTASGCPSSPALAARTGSRTPRRCRRGTTSPRCVFGSRVSPLAPLLNRNRFSPMLAINIRISSLHFFPSHYISNPFIKRLNDVSETCPWMNRRLVTKNTLAWTLTWQMFSTPARSSTWAEGAWFCSPCH